MPSPDTTILVARPLSGASPIRPRPSARKDAEAVSGSYLATPYGLEQPSVYGVDLDSNIIAIGGLNVIGPGQVLGTRAILTTAPRSKASSTPSRSASTTSTSARSSSSTSHRSPRRSPTIRSLDPTARVGRRRTLPRPMWAPLSTSAGSAADMTRFRGQTLLPAHATFIHVNADITHTRELDNGEFQLYAKLGASWPDGALISSEQFSLGGADTVRGYPSNRRSSAHSRHRSARSRPAALTSPTCFQGSS